MENEKLSDRIQVIIDTLMERVSSMEKSAKECVDYTCLIGEFFTLVNKVRRMEIHDPHNIKAFERFEFIVVQAEMELRKEIVVATNTLHIPNQVSQTTNIIENVEQK